MSTITKERLEQYAYDGRMCNINDEIREMARMALAWMEAEPVAYQYREHNPANGMKTTWATLDMFAYEIIAGDTDPETAEFRPLYAAPQPLTTSERAELENYRNAQQVVPEWTNEQCLEFLSIAFRHAEIKGDLEMDDIRLGVKMVNSCRAAMQSGAVKDGWVMVPKKLTAENGAKAALLGEFNLEYTLTCHECFGEGCDDCSGEGKWINTIPIDWTAIKDIWTKAIDHFAAAPQQEAE